MTPIIGIIEPTARYVGTYRGVKDKVGVIGTKVTITSHAYKSMIHMYNEKIDINSAGIREEYYEVYRLADRRTGI